MRDSRGFSLFEVMASMILISTLLAFSFPYVHTIRQTILFRNELSKLVMELHRAKMTALKNNSHVVLKILQNGYLIFEDNGKNGGNASDWIQQPDEKTVIRHQLPPLIRIRSTFTNNRTRFNGTLGVKAGRVILRDANGNAGQIVLNIVGRIRVERL